MARRILFFCLVITFSCGLHGQNSISDSLATLFENQFLVYPQEKIYLHTDKPYYISGEWIWFRAYLVDARSHVSVPVSRYVYVELINPLDSVVTRVKIRQVEEAYHGYLSIPDDAPEGDYTLRAYTAYMLNPDEHYFYTKSIHIGDPQARAIHTGTTLSDNKFDVAFYPEGGSLIEGALCKVAFKAMNSNGQAINITGIVYDQSGTAIQQFGTDHLGMGRFSLRAEKGKTYHAICRNKEQTKRFDLPAAVDHGYALSINRVKDKIYVSVLSTPDMQTSQSHNSHEVAQPRPSRSLESQNEQYLLAHTRGIVHFITLWNNEKNLTFQQDQMPSGVLHLILFDNRLHPVSERLVFINNEDQARLTCQPEQEIFTPRTLIKNHTTLTDSEGQPIAGSFSVSVTSDREVSPDTTTNILTRLLLSSDLRGHIENPAYYFQNTAASEYALDLLMLTQGWRRYDMATLAQGSPALPALPIELFPEISGTVKNAFGRPVNNSEVVVTSLKNDFIEKIQTDKNGRFYLRGIEWPDSTLFIVNAAPKKGMKNLELLIDDEKFPAITLHAAPPSVIDKERFAQYVEKAEQKYTSENGIRMINLPEVSVSAERKQIRTSKYLGIEKPDNIVTEERIKKSGVTDLAPVLNQITGVTANYFWGKYVIRIRNSWYPPLLIVDDFVWDNADDCLSEIDINSIEQVDVIKSANIFGVQGASGAIIIHTKRGEFFIDTTQPLYIKNITPLGYQQPVEFYAPKYDTPEKQNAKTPDLRTTIHWQPVVQTDSQGMACFEFYTADEYTSYTVVIEGIADDGSIIHQESKYFPVISSLRACFSSLRACFPSLRACEAIQNPDMHLDCFAGSQ